MLIADLWYVADRQIFVCSGPVNRLPFIDYRDWQLSWTILTVSFCRRDFNKQTFFQYNVFRADSGVA